MQQADALTLRVLETLNEAQASNFIQATYGQYLCRVLEQEL
jgi:hypothetical protein